MGHCYVHFAFLFTLIANQIIYKFIFVRTIYDKFDDNSMVMVMLYRRPYNNCTLVWQLYLITVVILAG